MLAAQKSGKLKIVKAKATWGQCMTKLSFFFGDGDKGKKGKKKGRKEEKREKKKREKNRFKRSSICCFLVCVTCIPFSFH